MTTYHEHVPQTRRAVRESERASADPQPEQFPFFSQTTPVQGSAEQPITRGRRARPAEPATPDALPPTQAIPAADRPSYRPRDFSPEGRRAAVESWSAPAEPAPAPVVSFAPPSTVPTAPQQSWRVDDAAPVEHTLSRRELRALREAQELGAAPAANPAPAAYQAPVVAEVPAVAEAPAAFAAPVELTPPPVQSAPAVVEPAPPVVEPVVAAGEPVAFSWLVAEPEPVAPVVPVQAAEPAAVPVAGPVAAVEADAPVLPQREVEPPSASTFTLPSNHWSRQLELDQETQPYESTINRVVGSAASATNALMLPEIPRGDIRGALTATGEVMLTGSIDLAPGFASTGSTRQMEHSGIDALFEQDDHEVVSTDSAPVRALRAVSTVSGTSLGSLPTPTKQKGTRGLTILLVTACGLAAVVTGLVIAAFAFNLF